MRPFPTLAALVVLSHAGLAIPSASAAPFKPTDVSCVVAEKVDGNYENQKYGYTYATSQQEASDTFTVPVGPKHEIAVTYDRLHQAVAASLRSLSNRSAYLRHADVRVADACDDYSGGEYEDDPTVIDQNDVHLGDRIFGYECDIICR